MAKLWIHASIFSSKKAEILTVCLEGSEKCFNFVAVSTEQGLPQVRSGLH